MTTPRLLIIGCGDVGLRVLQLLAGRWRVFALTSSPERATGLRAAGAVPLVGNLDEPATLARLAGLADFVLHLARPPVTETRTRARAGCSRPWRAGRRRPWSMRARPASTAIALATSSTRRARRTPPPTARAAASMPRPACALSAAATARV